MKYFLSIVFFLILAISTVNAQKSRLAAQYYQDGEYEKSAKLYSDLYKSTNSINYFNSYIRNLELSGQVDVAILAIKKEIKNIPGEVSLYVSLGGILENTGKAAEADRYFEKAIENLLPIPNEIRKIANRFVTYSKYDLAIKTYEKGLELAGPDGNMYYGLADVHRRKSQMRPMIKNYIESLVINAYRLSSIERVLQKNLEEDDFEILQSELFTKIQEDANPELYELLIWSYIYTKRFPAALRQGIALDKRGGEAGKRVLKIGETSLNERAYDTAIKAFSYIIEVKGSMSPYYFTATERLFEAKYEKIIHTQYTEDELQVLKSEYQQHLAQYGKNKFSAGIIRNLASLESKYLNEIDSAIILLTDILTVRDLDREDRAQIKLDLGDYYLINNERWESTLLYSQVDKDFQEDPLGHEARFRNAKLAYYMGDFEWAQVQFDVLKASTSKLISNNAIDMSVFIQDNLGLDTSEVALGMFARSDLYAIQKQQDSAFAILRQLKLDFPDHDLLDDVIYREANIYKELKNYDKAIERYEYLIKNYNEDIKADNALFELAEIYDVIVIDKTKAQELYERIFIDYDSSTFAVEARKRYRQLRGDEI